MRYTQKTNVFSTEELLTRNFKAKEFASPDGYIIWNPDTEKFMNMVQLFRVWYNRPIRPSRIYSTPEHNAKIGGIKNSEHLFGLAIDIPYPADYWAGNEERRKEFRKNIENKWREICAARGIIGGSIEICDRHFHLDIKPWADKKFHVYYGKSK